MIYGRPDLSKELSSGQFLEFYYLDTEMVDFCKRNGLDSFGDRNELKQRIAHYLAGGKGSSSKFVLKPEIDLSVITGDMTIENDFEFSEKHTAFFENSIGYDFVPYEDFIVWLEQNTGKTYDEAVDFWYLINDDINNYR